MAKTTSRTPPSRGGSFQNKTFDIHLEGEDAGIDCERFYAPPPGTAANSSGNYDTSQLYFAVKELGAVIELCPVLPS